ncbi:type II secretion system protein N [Kaarinaea lacus]
MRLPFDKRYLLLGVLAYIIVLVLNFPAEVAYAHWKNSEAAKSKAGRQFSLVGISGSVWSGQAGLGVIQGQSVKDVEWNLRPWSLLLGQVGLGWSFRLPDSTGNQGFGRGITSMGLGGSLTFSELEMNLPLIEAAKLVGMSALRPSGSVNLNLQDVEWDGQSLVSATGRVVWRDAGVSLVRSVSLGDLTMDLETEDNKIKGHISDSGGPLSIDAVLNLSADGAYQVNGTLAARNDPSGDNTLQTTLRSMGRPGPDGKVRIDYSGTLAKLGLAPKRVSK